MKAFIVNPKSYFKEENIRLKFSLLILLAASLSQITDSIALSYYIITLSDAAGPLIVGSLIAAFGEMAAIIGLWFLYSSICHTMSLVIGGEGSFRDMLISIGYGFLPLIMVGLIKGGLAYYILSSVLSGYIGPVSPSQIAGILTSHRLYFAIMSIAGLFWSFHIWTAALEARHKLTLPQAIKTGLPAIMVGLVLNIYPLL